VLPVDTCRSAHAHRFDGAAEIDQRIDIWSFDAIRRSTDVVGDKRIVADLKAPDVR
jgi:hypothetical protein